MNVHNIENTYIIGKNKILSFFKLNRRIINDKIQTTEPAPQVNAKLLF